MKNSRGMAEALLYEHINEKVGCSYRIETNTMINAEMKMLRKDGTEAKL